MFGHGILGLGTRFPKSFLKLNCSTGHILSLINRKAEQTLCGIRDRSHHQNLPPLAVLFLTPLIDAVTAGGMVVKLELAVMK